MATIEALSNQYDSAIPLEYRYRTSMSGALVAGLAGLAVALVFVRGSPALLLGAVSLWGVVYGAMGLIADARGFTRSAGKKLIITDDMMQEVDERGRILWTIRPTEIDAVRPQKGPRVYPFSGDDGWRAETWVFMLKDGREVAVPVWLLPDKGRRFRQRFENFIAFARRRGTLKRFGPAA
ncbi:hypothetical protein FJY71_02510 [candidate division WOR-3 bacterium]|nr:hypothetical protein [candidate division WOR-3 bacterium]